MDSGIPWWSFSLWILRSCFAGTQADNVPFVTDQEHLDRALVSPVSALLHLVRTVGDRHWYNTELVCHDPAPLALA